MALRELSLRFVADETEEELLEFLRSRGAHGDVWDTAERIMVAVTGAPGNATVIRRAARIAARIKADLLAVHVVSGRRRARRRPARPSSRSWCGTSGGTWQTVEGDDVAKTIFAAAIDHQITQIVLGTSRLTRWQSMTRGSVIQQILRMASENDIDVHVIARRDRATAGRTTAGRARRGRLAPGQVGEGRVGGHRGGRLHAAVQVGQRLGPPGVAGQVLGHGDRVGRPSGLLRPKTAWSTMCSSGRSLMPR